MRQKIIVEQFAVNNGYKYLVKSLVNVLEPSVGEELDKRQLRSLMSQGKCDVQIFGRREEKKDS